MAVELRPLPPADAIKAFEARGHKLTETFSWQDAWQREHATMFTVAKSAGFDILNDIESSLTAALSQGQTIQQFSRNLRPVLEEKGWWGRKIVTDHATGQTEVAQLGSARRLQTIFDANMRVSYAAGHWSGFEQNRSTRPFLRYVAILDDRTRPAHRARHNLVLPIDHPYWNTWAPPCGWNCRCTLQSLSRRDIRRLQDQGEELFFEPPKDTFSNFVNKRTGEVIKVPDGIDPGWAYNPGRAGYEAKVNQAFAEKIADAPPEFVAAAVEERLASSAFDRFFEDPQGSMPLTAVPAPIAKAIDREARVALLSGDVMARQRRQQPELTVADYRSIQKTSATATLIIQDGAEIFSFSPRSDGRWLEVAFSANGSAPAISVTSVRLVASNDIGALLARKGIRILVDER